MTSDAVKDGQALQPMTTFGPSIHCEPVAWLLGYSVRLSQLAQGRKGSARRQGKKNSNNSMELGR